ncbi:MULTISPECIES: VOC family protein [unclassified Peribacillus]|uniref:VOC family protein n=1 Tax=unclassified Peribacillus TaxID=2675266 RepID=UPI001F4EA751|nr:MULTISPECIES: VOC family protein [unclassified Peribacillus]MCK1985994.1 VOC family protein [Peribacillus sp. Aquil_B1]MCK2011217.1 VOC family protein [Peribacillus sp. Aquil_B8]
MIKESIIEVDLIDHIQLDVANLEESISFYSKVFGFELIEIGVRATTRWAIVGNKANIFLCMHEFAEGRDIENQGLEITHFGLIVRDFDNTLEKLKSHNVELFYDHLIEYHSSRSIYFRDPNGYKLEISERIGGGIQ